MTSLNPSLKLLRVLAGEGSFHIYRLLRERRLFLFTKCLLTTFACFRGTGTETSARSIAFVKGANQLRYFRHVKDQLEDELGPVQLYASSRLPTAPEALLLPRISWSAFVHQVICLFMLLLTSRRRYLNLYLLAFASAMEKAVAAGWRNIESFVCFNDQPYDVAAIVIVLNRPPSCRTIVIQHGLIISQKFYFPSVAKEFWAWGELSRKHYCSRDKNAQLVLKGRYKDDKQNKASDFVCMPSDRPIRLLVAPSYFHNEAQDILLKVGAILSCRNQSEIYVAVKFHPATKIRSRLRIWIRNNVKFVREENQPMEVLAIEYDALVTKNSSSAVDFLLLGKPVFFSEFAVNEFPSPNYGFSLEDLGLLRSGVVFRDSGKNQVRKIFLNDALNA